MSLPLPLPISWMYFLLAYHLCFTLTLDVFLARQLTVFSCTPASGCFPFKLTYYLFSECFCPKIFPLQADLLPLSPNPWLIPLSVELPLCESDGRLTPCVRANERVFPIRLLQMTDELGRFLIFLGRPVFRFMC